ncbi:hypothetical protein RRG08_024473 [Elysia crispata]|uniref:Uncharacterized protein n=1 Tax=Elysia crispata TaxID=231223 RepID=A0AAE0YPH3_9GAST|nr:hypothetical protein RRG08_024473 [Elysia crispata]
MINDRFATWVIMKLEVEAVNLYTLESQTIPRLVVLSSPRCPCPRTQPRGALDFLPDAASSVYVGVADATSRECWSIEHLSRGTLARCTLYKEKLDSLDVFWRMPFKSRYLETKWLRFFRPITPQKLEQDPVIFKEAIPRRGALTLGNSGGFTTPQVCRGYTDITLIDLYWEIPAGGIMCKRLNACSRSQACRTLRVASESNKQPGLLKPEVPPPLSSNPPRSASLAHARGVRPGSDFNSRGAEKASELESWMAGPGSATYPDM